MQNENIRVLLIEDDEDDYILTRELLQDIPSVHYEMTWVSNFDEGLRALRSNEHDVCLLDFRLGAYTGLDVLRSLGSSVDHVPPVIMLTGMASRDMDMETMHLGASDYLDKGELKAQILERTIRYTIQQRRSLADLRTSETLNRSILSSISSVIIVLNTAGTVLSSNLDAPRFQAKPECALQDVQIGTDYLALCQREIQADNEIARQISAGLAGVMSGETQTYFLEYVCKQAQKEPWFALNITPLADQSGGAVLTFTDVSERVWATEEIKRLNDDLEDRVNRRTQELADANRRLTILDRLKSKFVADVSHELRTPIANLKLYTSLMKRGVPDKRNHYLDVIDDQINRLTALVEDTLTLSRLETGDDTLSLGNVDVTAMIQGLVASYQEQAQTKGIDLSADIAPELPLIQADADKIDLLLHHLIINALNYTHTGTIHIQVFAQAERLSDPNPTNVLLSENAASLTDGNYLRGADTVASVQLASDGGDESVHPGICITLQDTGIGISDDDLTHIFDRFYRGYGEQLGDIAGTGLGLPIVRTVAQMHGGHVQAQSQLHHGSVFRVWLPQTPLAPPAS